LRTTGSPQTTKCGNGHFILGPNELHPGAVAGFVRPQTYTIFAGTSLRKRIQNYKYKIRHENEYLE